MAVSFSLAGEFAFSSMSEVVATFSAVEDVVAVDDVCRDDDGTALSTMENVVGFTTTFKGEFGA